MTVTTGSRLGPYLVGPRLGAGGMGEVYRAHDPRLGRDVAIKALPLLDRTDADRLGRFEREAQILAALNHPHIAAIYGLEEADGSQFLVLELVEGGTLAGRLSAGPIPLREAVTIARQIADGLHAAHDKGIVHRDLKPANIALTPDGHVKVLDFGVARTFTLEADATTAQHPLTQEGTVLGTAAYMSPEQTRGLPLDKRADIWAFGCVLYEMLTGRRPFAGESVSDTIAAVLGRDPDWAALPASTPPRVQWLLRRCLEKDRKRRLHDIADAGIELEDTLSMASESLPAANGALALRTKRGDLRERLAWMAAVISVAALAGTVIAARLGLLAPAPTELPVYRSSIVLPDQFRLAAPDPAGRFALSPDGRNLAMVAADAGGQSMLWVRSLDGVVAQPLAGTEGAAYPFWSPDSRFLAFVVRTAETTGLSGQLKKVAVTGGEVVTLCDVSFSATGTWNREDVILFTPEGSAPLHRVSAAGGATARVTTLRTDDGEVQHSYPFFLPDGRHFVYSSVGTGAGAATDPAGVYVGALGAESEGKLLIEGASHAKYANGYLIYVQATTLLAQPFELARLELTGQPRPLVEQIQIAGRAGSGVSAAFSVSDTGVLAYQTSSLVRSQLAWFDRAGQRIATVGDQADYEEVALSPDGSRAAVSVRDPVRGTRDLWLYDLARGLREPFTFDPSDEIAPVWSSDGTQMIFTSTRGGGITLVRKPVSGSGDEETLPADSLGLGRFAASWSPDRQFLMYVAGGRIIARSDLWIVPLSDRGEPYALLETPFIETQGRFSPDGRWIAFMMNASGVPEVYVTPFPGPGARTRVSASGGSWPRWHQDGRELFYLAGDRLMAAAVSGEGAEFRVGEVAPLFTVRTRPSTRLDAYPYDVSPDGQRFLINTFVDDIKPGAITLVVRWPATLER